MLRDRMRGGEDTGRRVPSEGERYLAEPSRALRGAWPPDGYSTETGRFRLAYRGRGRSGVVPVKGM